MPSGVIIRIAVLSIWAIKVRWHIVCIDFVLLDVDKSIKSIIQYLWICWWGRFWKIQHIAGMAFDDL